MLLYHVAIPLAVLAGLLLFGVPIATAIVYALAAGCAGMVLMMFTGHGHAGQGRRPPTQHTTHTEQHGSGRR